MEKCTSALHGYGAEGQSVLCTLADTGSDVEMTLLAGVGALVLGLTGWAMSRARRG